jgi:hypothetical protein
MIKNLNKYFHLHPANIDRIEKSFSPLVFYSNRINIYRLSKKNKKFAFTAATFPNPTDVNEVMAKKSAVTYFDFKSGPLSVSFTTKNT